MKLHTFLSTSLLALAACSGGGSSSDSGDAQFTGKDPQHLGRAIAAATGTDGTLAMILGSAYAGAPATTTCPTITHSGADTTVTANGCVDGNGNKFDGSITIKNMPALFGDNSAYDASRPTDLEFDNWNEVDQGSSPLVVDGTAYFTQTTMTLALDLTFGGLHARDDAAYSINAGAYTADFGAFVDVDGLGSADVSGTWKMPDNSSGTNSGGAGSITLAGAETLVIDFADSNGQKCLKATIDGKAVTSLCQP